MVESGFGALGPGRAPGLDPDEFHEKTQKSDDAKSGARRQHDLGKLSTVRRTTTNTLLHTVNTVLVHDCTCILGRF